MLFLSYTLNADTPTYGNRNRFELEKKASIARGDTANDSSMATTVHIGTHIDLPYHFHENGQTVDAYDADFWVFEHPLLIGVEPRGYVLKEEVIDALNKTDTRDADLLIIKTGICHHRHEERFWDENYGLDPSLYMYIRDRLPNVRVVGFDSISISSFRERLIGREAHRVFLNPEAPLLILEDMDLRHVDASTPFKRVIVAPLRIEGCDGLPCTVIGELHA